MSAQHLLPDSRLQNQSFGAMMVDWQLPDGRLVRIEVVPIFCANCGKLYGHVPKDNTTFTCWLCRKCFDKLGGLPGHYDVPEDEFNRAVAYEMERKFGRALSDVEILALKEQGKLPRELELLERESPYPVPSS